MPACQIYLWQPTILFAGAWLIGDEFPLCPLLHCCDMFVMRFICPDLRYGLPGLSELEDLFLLSPLRYENDICDVCGLLSLLRWTVSETPLLSTRDQTPQSCTQAYHNCNWVSNEAIAEALLVLQAR